MVRFGPAGNSDSFSAMGYKDNKQIPKYLEDKGLNAFEYQCGRGVKISQRSAMEFGEEARKHNIQLSLHAPYYISLSSVDADKRAASVDYIVQSAKAVTDMGGERIVVHSGSSAKMPREQAMYLARETLKNAVKALDEKGYSHVRMCIETMGKFNQLGTLDEVLELCTVDERILPCIDFGHINARTLGSLKNYEDFERIFDAIERKLGEERLHTFHSHFSKIEYTEKGGEKCHLTFEDTVFGPCFDYIAEIIAKKNILPTFICESAGTQAEDAQTMMNMYLLEKNK